MGENIGKPCIWSRANIQNIERTASTQQKQKSDFKNMQWT